MRTLAIVLSLLFAAASLQAQRLAKVNLLEFYDKLPAPPSSAKGAHGRVEWNRSTEKGVCSTEKLFGSFETELTRVDKEIGSPAPSLGLPPGAGAADMAAKMKDPEFKKKMKSMSKEEKMKLAMEMSQGMMGSTVSEDPDAIKKALEEQRKLNDAFVNDFRKLESEVVARSQAADQRRAKHKEIDEWGVREEQKVPQLSSGEMSYPEPKAYKAFRLKLADKHIALADEELKTIRKQFQEEKDHNVKLFGPFQRALAAARYGDDARNPSSCITLANGQGRIVGTLKDLLKLSKEAYSEGARWYEMRVEAEKLPTK